jgi:predicted nucleic acid-binding protein
MIREPNVYSGKSDMPLILLDTNILIYANDTNDPKRQERAEQIVQALFASSQGRLSIQVLAEFAHVAFNKKTLSIPFEQIVEQVALFSRIWRVHELTPLIILEALRAVRDFSLSYYDAQIWACAKLNQISVIFSEDFQDGQTLEGVRFVNPFVETFEMEKWIQ